MLALVAAAAWVVRRTLFGRWVLAVGGNEAAARLSGIPVNAVRRGVYVISGLCAGIAGLVVVAINSSSDANLVGLGMELDAIAAVAVGGTPLTGGQATVTGTLIGALIIQLLRYTLLANGIPGRRGARRQGGRHRLRGLAPAARRTAMSAIAEPASSARPWSSAPARSRRASACSSRWCC